MDSFVVYQVFDTCSAECNPTIQSLRELFNRKYLLNAPVVIGHSANQKIGGVVAQLRIASKLYAIMKVSKKWLLSHCSLEFSANLSANQKQYTRITSIGHVALTNNPRRLGNKLIGTFDSMDMLKLALLAISLGVSTANQLLVESEGMDELTIKKKIVAKAFPPYDFSNLSEVALDEIIMVLAETPLPQSTIEMEMVEAPPQYGIHESTRSTQKPAITVKSLRNRSF